MWNRRILVWLILFATGSGQAETVWGELRDGVVHHERIAVAASHSVTRNGEHGHEHMGETGERDDRHEHGTSSDHCTHQHGVSTPAVMAFVLGFAVTAASPVATSDSTDRPPSGFFHPPRA